MGVFAVRSFRHSATHLRDGTLALLQQYLRRLQVEAGGVSVWAINRESGGVGGDGGSEGGRAAFLFRQGPQGVAQVGLRRGPIERCSFAREHVKGGGAGR